MDSDRSSEVFWPMDGRACCLTSHVRQAEFLQYLGVIEDFIMLFRLRGHGDGSAWPTRRERQETLPVRKDHRRYEVTVRSTDRLGVIYHAPYGPTVLGVAVGLKLELEGSPLASGRPRKLTIAGRKVDLITVNGLSISGLT
jgi:hypothetical protein